MVVVYQVTFTFPLQHHAKIFTPLTQSGDIFGFERPKLHTPSNGSHRVCDSCPPASGKSIQANRITATFFCHQLSVRMDEAPSFACTGFSPCEYLNSVRIPHTNPPRELQESKPPPVISHSIIYLGNHFQVSPQVGYYA